MNEPVFSDDRPADGPREDRPSDESPSRLVPIIFIGLLLVVVVYIARPKPAPTGVPLTDLHLQPLVGNASPIRLSDLEGQVVLINFWGTWCGPCMFEFPELVKMNKRLKAEPDFRFIPVSCPPGRDANVEQLQADTENYFREQGFELTAHYDPGGATRFRLMQDLQLSGFSFPTTVLLNREGAVQGLWIGYQPGIEVQIEQKIEQLLH